MTDLGNAEHTSNPNLLSTMRHCPIVYSPVWLTGRSRMVLHGMMYFYFGLDELATHRGQVELATSTWCDDWQELFLQLVKRPHSIRATPRRREICVGM